MPIAPSRFGSPRNSQSFQPEPGRGIVIDPTKGFHAGKAASLLTAGYTPESRNFVVDGGWIRPRSGLSQFGSVVATGPVLGGSDVFDTEGNQHALALSSGTALFLSADDGSWSTLSYIRGSLSADTQPSGISTDYWETTHIYEPVFDQNIGVWTNGIQLPYWARLDASNRTFSAFTWATSLFSYAKACAAFDNRLIFANVVSTESRLPQRIVWSARGNPVDYTIANGAGFDDLMDLRGGIQKVVPEQDGILVFGDFEVWRGRRRRDAYAFDFYPVLRGMGCPYPRTIAQTPEGVVFLGRDLEVYLLAGAELIPLGLDGPGGVSRIQPYLQTVLVNGGRAWAVYNPAVRRYELYSAATSTSGFPNRAFYYSLDNRSWFEQRFAGHDLSFGFVVRDPSQGVTWDSYAASATWDNQDAPWDRVTASAGTLQNVVAWSSGGTPYRLLSTQTTDDGTAIDCRWRHGLGPQADPFRWEHPSELWLKYEAGSASSLSVWQSEDLGNTYTDSYGVALSASSYSAAYAPLNFTAMEPTVEVRLNDGGTPRLGQMKLALQRRGKFPGNARA